MNIRVLNIAFPLAPVNKDSAGGAEQVLYTLDKALVEQKQFSVVVASVGSKVNGKLIESTGSEKLDDMHIKMVRAQHKILIEKALEMWEFDIVHMHGVDFDSYLPPAGIPVLVTLHLPIDWYNTNLLNSQIPATYFNCVSKSQYNSAQGTPNLINYIENGIDVEKFLFKKEKENFALTLGRICPEKGYHLAVEAAKISGMPLKLAGEVFGYDYHQKYFENEIVPQLDNEKLQFIGPVGFEKKRELLSSAKCVLIPSLVNETSSLVAMEALASGTPVIAFSSGALKEIINDGKTGFIVNDQFEMAEAISELDLIDPEDCRNAALKYFDSRRMIKEYFSLYKKIISKSFVKSKIYY